MRIVDQSVRIVSPKSEDDAVEQLRQVEFAGRNCYQSHDKITEDSYDSFVKMLMKREHYSPLEFADMIVEMVVGRDVMAEITRHRIASFAIKSQRYCRENKSGDIEFIRPDFWVPEDELMDAKKWCASRKWEQECKNQEEAYSYLADVCKLKPQDARVVLGNSCATVIVMKASLREWLHIFDLRTSDGAYPMMKKVMTDLLNQAVPIYETVFGGKHNELHGQSDSCSTTR